MYFKKVPLTYKVNPDPKKLMGNVLAHYINLQDGSWVFTYYAIKDQTYFRQLHTKDPFRIPPDSVRYCEIVGRSENVHVTPHIDVRSLVVLNYYIEPVGCTTFFYKKKKNASPYSNPVAQTQNKLYNKSDLILVDQFKARKNSAYFLDTSKVHSILMPSSHGSRVRKFISYSWEKNSFEELIESKIVM